MTGASSKGTRRRQLQAPVEGHSNAAAGAALGVGLKGEGAARSAAKLRAVKWGRSGQLTGLLQEWYGYTRERAEAEFNRRLREAKDA